MKQYDSKKQTDLAILDFSKAFDTVPHQKLLYKLKNYGIDGKINIWIESFLTKRKQQAVIDGECSDSCSVDSGVPQGTVLGPFLFLCHINDLPTCVKSKVRLFADDCLLYTTVKTIKDQIQLQQDLKSLEVWADKWGMRFNASKCYIMSIHRARTPLSYHYSLDNHILEQVNENPYLGLNISDNLKWSSQVNKVCNKANSTLGFIRRNLKHCNKKFKETAYISLVRSVLDYSATVWDPYLTKDIERLKSIQRRGARFVQNDYQRTSSVTSMMNELGWKPLAHRRREQRLILLFKIINDLVAIPATDHIAFNTRPPRSRHNKQIKVIAADSEIYRNSFFPRTIKDWNLLPESAVNSDTVNSFKSSISCY